MTYLKKLHTDNQLIRCHDLCPLIQGRRCYHCGLCLQVIALPTRLGSAHMIHPYRQFHAPHVMRYETIPLALDGLAQVHIIDGIVAESQTQDTVAINTSRGSERRDNSLLKRWVSAMLS